MNVVADERSSDPRPAAHQDVLGEKDQQPVWADRERGAEAAEERLNKVPDNTRTIEYYPL